MSVTITDASPGVHNSALGSGHLQFGRTRLHSLVSLAGFTRAFEMVCSCAVWDAYSFRCDTLLLCPLAVLGTSCPVALCLPPSESRARLLCPTSRRPRYTRLLCGGSLAHDDNGWSRRLAPRQLPTGPDTQRPNQRVTHPWGDPPVGAIEGVPDQGHDPESVR